MMKFKGWNLSPYHPCQQIQPLSTLRHLTKMELYPIQRAHNRAKPGPDQRCNPECAVINPGDNVAQGTWSPPDPEGVAGPGWTAERNADGREVRLFHTNVRTVWQGILELSEGNTQELCKESIGKEIRMWQVLGWLNLQGKCVDCLKPSLQWTHLGLRK